MFLPASLEFAAARREDVLDPLRLAAVGERDDEVVRRSEDVHRGAVDFARFATHVRENAEARKPACEQTGDPVRKDDVDLRQPSLPKAHHDNA